jgi:hypothetical protein
MIDYDKEDDDPIVAEVRRAREVIAAKFNYDLAAIFKHMQELTEEAARAGHPVVSPPPRRPEGRQEPPQKKVG